MAKSLVNFREWSTDEIRLLVVMLLTVIYPLFVASFYALYIFVILPEVLPSNYDIAVAHAEGWYHHYWLFATLLWVLLCCLILPWFQDEKKAQQTMVMSDIESPPCTTTLHQVQPIIQVEERDESQSHESEKPDESLTKESCEEKATKESMEKSTESLQKSRSSLERMKLTQSGEFLNDFMNTVQPKESKNNETVCEVHAEKSKDDIKESEDESDNDNTDANKYVEQDQSEDKSSEEYTSEEDPNKDGEQVSGGERVKEGTEDDSNKGEGKEAEASPNKKENDSSSLDLSNYEIIEPAITPEKTEKSQTSAPQQVREAIAVQHSSTDTLDKLEEADTLDSDIPELRKKALPTIDTSRASGYNEYSMPTPKSADSTKLVPESNMVFLFVNPETAGTEDSVLVSHAGQVQDAESKTKES